MSYRAATALPHNEPERPKGGLREQLRLMAFADGVMPDWSTLTIEGPVEVTGLHGAIWYEWMATVEASAP